jgi:hypothetical protein
LAAAGTASASTSARTIDDAMRRQIDFKKHTSGGEYPEQFPVRRQPV